MVTKGTYALCKHENITIHEGPTGAKWATCDDCERDPGPRYDPQPRNCRNCGERYRACGAAWMISMQCCDECDHPGIPVYRPRGRPMINATLGFGVLAYFAAVVVGGIAIFVADVGFVHAHAVGFGAGVAVTVAAMGWWDR